MDREILVQRIQELARIVDESAATHNMNVGAFREAQVLLDSFDKESEGNFNDDSCNI